MMKKPMEYNTCITIIPGTAGQGSIFNNLVLRTSRIYTDVSRVVAFCWTEKGFQLLFYVV